MRVRVEPSIAEGETEAPPSKSWSQRALFLALLARGETALEGLPTSDDVMASLEAVKAFGAEVVKEGSKTKIISEGEAKVPEDVINMRGSGTGARIAIGIATTLPKGFGAVVTGDHTLRRRPMGPVIELFNSLGAEVRSVRGDKLPVVAFGHLRGGDVETDGSVTSQHVTSALIAGNKAEETLKVKIRRPVSRSYIALTVSVARLFGSKVSCNNEMSECSVSPSDLKAIRAEVPGDYALAAFPLVAGALTGGRVTVRGLPEPEGKFGDHKVIEYMRRFGAEVRYSNGSVTVEGGELRGATVNLRDEPDLALPLAALAAEAKGESVLTGLRHLAYKESNRIKTIVETLRCFGVSAQAEGGSIRIWGGIKKRCKLKCPGDHRIAMMAAVMGTVMGSEIDSAECVSKSWPEFWDAMETLGVKVYVG